MPWGLQLLASPSPKMVGKQEGVLTLSTDGEGTLLCPSRIHKQVILYRRGDLYVLEAYTLTSQVPLSFDIVH